MVLYRPQLPICKGCRSGFRPVSEITTEADGLSETGPGRLYCLSDALLDSQGAADQSVRQIRQHLKPCLAAQTAGILVACLPPQLLGKLYLTLGGSEVLLLLVWMVYRLAVPILIERMSA